MDNSNRISIRRFTLIELLVKRSHLCCNRTDDSEKRYSPAHGQVKLLVGTSQHCRHFIHNSCFASAKQNSLFLTLLRPAGYGGQEDKTSPYNTCRANASCTAHNAVFASAKTYSLFLKRREGCGERGKTSFPGKRGFSSLPAPLSPFQEKRKSFCWRKNGVMCST